MLDLAKFRKLAALSTFLVLMLFLFPVQVGSFQATHGPTSTLKELALEILIQALVALVSAMLLIHCVLSCCFSMAGRNIFAATKVSKPRNSSLRC